MDALLIKRGAEYFCRIDGEQHYFFPLPLRKFTTIPIEVVGCQVKVVDRHGRFSGGWTMASSIQWHLGEFTHYAVRGCAVHLFANDITLPKKIIHDHVFDPLPAVKDIDDLGIF